MFTIGAFAAMGRVSVRMLRHYDAIGLLEPASIDEVSGYRYYRADQLRRLNRLLALKDLGFTLDEVKSILDESIEIDDLRGMLQSRQAELASQIAADTQRLGRVDARLRMIEREGFAADVTGPTAGHARSTWSVTRNRSPTGAPRCSSRSDDPDVAWPYTRDFRAERTAVGSRERSSGRGPQIVMITVNTALANSAATVMTPVPGGTSQFALLQVLMTA